MPITADAAFDQEIAGTVIHRELAVTLTLPVLGALDATLNVQSLTYSDQDTSSYPDALTVKSGDTDLSGTLVLAGSTASGDVVALLDADNPASPLYQQDTLEGTLLIREGVNAAGAPDLVTVTVAYVTTISADVLAATVTIEFTDVPDGFDQLPDGLLAVLTPPPWNAGLTNEFAYDRLARAASGGAVSSWPEQRPKCVVAAGMRTSVWPEVGTLLANNWVASPSFVPGAFGSALSALGPLAVGTGIMQYAAAKPMGADVTLECWMLPSTGTTQFDVTTSGIANQFSLQRVGADLTFLIGSLMTGGTFTGLFATSGPPQYFGIHFSFNVSTGACTVTIRVRTLGGAPADYTQSLTAFPGTAGSPSDVVQVTALAGGIEALQVTTESSPVWNDGFTPKASFDPSLNVLQVAPAIDKGSSAWNELQTAVEAECGWIGWRAGVLTFLNRETIATQAPWKTITAEHDLETLQKQSTSNATFNDVAMDVTEWQFSDPTKGQGFVYSPVKVLHFPAKQTVTFERDLPNGITAGQVDQTIGYFTSGTAKPAADGNSVWQLSKDRNGLNEHPKPSNVVGTVSALTPSRIRITVANGSAVDAYAASPAVYVNPNFNTGDPSLWIGGVKATPDQPSTLHGGAGGVPSFPAQTNAYNQDRGSTQAAADFTAAQLSSPKTTYTNVSVIPDPRYQVADRATLQVPTGTDGGFTPLDVFVWGRNVTIDFDAESYDMTLDVRAVAAPGEAVLDVSVLDVDTFLY